MPRVAAGLALLVLLAPQASALLSAEDEFAMDMDMDMDMDQLTEEAELFKEEINAVLRARFTTEQLQQMEAEGSKQTEELVNMQTLATSEEEEDPVDGAWNDMLLQHSPPRWFHCPKCGSSFVNVLMHIPGLCPDVPPGFFLSVDTMGWHFLSRFTLELGFAKHCPPLRQFGGHVGFGANQTNYDKHIKGKAMGMFRKPESRITSAFHDGMTVNKGKIVKAITSSWAWQDNESTSDIDEYGKRIQGCVAKMLTRKGFACGGPKLDAEEVDMAIERVKDFAFVGLLEEWELSVCLWHKMFGGKCRSYEMMNSRPSVEKKVEKRVPAHIAKILAAQLDPSFKDPFDGPVYEVAKARFWSDVEKYNVSAGTCAPCVEEAKNDKDILYELDTNDTSARGEKIRAKLAAAKRRQGFTKKFAAWLDHGFMPATTYSKLPRMPTRYAQYTMKKFGVR